MHGCSPSWTCPGGDCGEEGPGQREEFWLSGLRQVPFLLHGAGNFLAMEVKKKKKITLQGKKKKKPGRCPGSHKVAARMVKSSCRPGSRTQVFAPLCHLGPCPCSWPVHDVCSLMAAPELVLGPQFFPPVHTMSLEDRHSQQHQAPQRPPCVSPVKQGTTPTPDTTPGCRAPKDQAWVLHTCERQTSDLGPGTRLNNQRARAKLPGGFTRSVLCVQERRGCPTCPPPLFSQTARSCQSKAL